MLLGDKVITLASLLMVQDKFTCDIDRRFDSWSSNNKNHVSQCFPSDAVVTGISKQQDLDFVIPSVSSYNITD